MDNFNGIIGLPKLELAKSVADTPTPVSSPAAYTDPVNPATDLATKLWGSRSQGHVVSNFTDNLGSKSIQRRLKSGEPRKITLDTQPLAEQPQPQLQPQIQPQLQPQLQPQVQPQPQIQPQPQPQSVLPINSAETNNLVKESQALNERSTNENTEHEKALQLIHLVSSSEEDEDKVDVNKVLEAIPELTGGPSQGGFSIHTLEACKECWRKAFFKFIKGYSSKRKKKPLQFGSLYHACWELWYKTGGAKTYQDCCTLVRQAGAPKLAAEVGRLVYEELKAVSAEEATTWDIRAVEQNAIFWSDPIKINKKYVRLPFTCRHDLLISKRKPGEPCAPAGPAPNGITIVDRKTTSALTYAYVKGYEQDVQFLMNALVYKRSTEEEKLGKLKSMIFAVAAKHKKISPDKSFPRIETMTNDAVLEEFYQTELIPLASEFYAKFTSPDRENEKLWPKNTFHCNYGRYGVCEFVDLCSGLNQSVGFDFEIDPSWIFTTDRLADPPKTASASKSTTDAKKERSKTPRQIVKEEITKIAANNLCYAVLDIVASDYLVPDHTEESVKLALVETIKNTLQDTTKVDHIKYKDEHIIITYTKQDKNIKWSTQAKVLDKSTKFSGVLSYKKAASIICEEWWNLDHNDPVPPKTDSDV